MSYLQGRKSSNHPTCEELISILSHLLTISKRTFIVVDALDECAENERDLGLLVFLEHLCALTRSDHTDTRLFVASRPEPDIARCMKRLAPQNLDFHDEAQHRDELLNYITHQLEREAYRWLGDAKAQAVFTLNEKADGM